MRDEYIGVGLAVFGSFIIGSSYVITKMGLGDASERHGFKGDGYEYVKSPMWWGGMITLVVGEIFNFAAYAFAPAVLVTPLGALSVLTATVLGAYFLKERLGHLGKLGCVLCVVKSVLIVANAPAERDIQTVDEILELAVQPGFLLFCLLTTIFTLIMIYLICPQHGTSNPLHYLSVCAATGAISVMALKSFGIALKLTFAGSNQFTRPSTYLFAAVAVFCIAVQMKYFNKALNTFPQSVVSPIYYVTFTTGVLTASFVLFQGFNMTSVIETTRLLCGFMIIFCGVYMLN
ncbi:magnesium transporter, partial [Leptodontidium sp. 2 PMI_412]